MRRKICILVFAGLGLTCLLGASQEEKPPSDDVFSGNVVTCSDVQVTVSRKGPARETVTRTFAIDGQTKVEGTMKPKVRVTVRFVPQGEGLLAVHIIVR